MREKDMISVVGFSNVSKETRGVNSLRKKAD